MFTDLENIIEMICFFEYEYTIYSIVIILNTCWLWSDIHFIPVICIGLFQSNARVKTTNAPASPGACVARNLYNYLFVYMYYGWIFGSIFSLNLILEMTKLNQMHIYIVYRLRRHPLVPTWTAWQFPDNTWQKRKIKW